MLLELVLIAALLLGVVFVNGWTDAPNSIATVVITGVMDKRRAVAMAALCNFLGVLVMTLINRKVAQTVSELTVFYGAGKDPLVALCAALFAVIVWAVAAWAFGIPTSESHALLAGLSGAGMALGGAAAVNAAQWLKVLLGLVISTTLGLFGGYALARVVGALTRGKRDTFFSKAMKCAAAAMAFLHGAQDGQKFLGVFMVAMYLGGWAQRPQDGFLHAPVWLMALCALVMGLGTSLGGGRIIQKVGTLARLDKSQGFSADAAAAGCLLLCSLSGLPVSTTHTKTTAVMGAGAARTAAAVDWTTAREMALAWVLTFPCCAIIGFGMAKLFLVIF